MTSIQTLLNNQAKYLAGIGSAGGFAGISSAGYGDLFKKKEHPAEKRFNKKEQVELFDNLVNFLWPDRPDKYNISKIMMPLIRKVYPTMITSNMISVQPIMKPSETVFYLNYKKTDEPEENS